MINKLIKLLGGVTQEELDEAIREVEVKQTSEELNEMYPLDYYYVQIARKQVGSVDLDTSWIDEMPKQERNTILTEAHDILYKESLDKIINELANRQIRHIAQEAGSFEEMNFGRGTLNGINLLKEELESLDSIYASEHQKAEDFDPYKIINEE